MFNQIIEHFLLNVPIFSDEQYQWLWYTMVLLLFQYTVGGIFQLFASAFGQVLNIRGVRRK